MKLARTVTLLVVALLWWAFGPVVLVLALLGLCLRRVRAWLRPTRRVVVRWVVVVLAVAGLLWLVPDGWLPLPPGPGALVAPSYVGRPAIVEADEVAAPLGESPQVTTRSYGLPGCTRIAFDTHGRLVTTCGHVLRLLDPDSLRQLASKELPGSCPAVFALTDGRVRVVAGDQLLTVATADAEGEPDLTTVATVDLPDAGCPTGLGVDGAERVWFATTDGEVGLVAGGRIRSTTLDDEVDQPITVAPDAVYVAGARALHKVVASGDRPVTAWVSAYGDGESFGAAPVVLPTGLVAVAVDRSPRVQVVVHRGDTGDVVCRTEVFADDEGAVDGGLVGADDGVLVLNAHGYAGPASTVLGRTTTGGIARVDVDAGECRVTWTSDLDAPSGAPAVSADAGLAYAWTKRHSWLGVDAWYLSAVQLDTGRLAWSRRTGLGVFHDNHHGVVALGPDGAAYTPVLGGFVRVADRS